MKLDVIERGLALDPLVVVVDGDGEDPLGALLPYDVLLEDLLYLHGLGKVELLLLYLFLLVLLGDDVVTELDAFVADIDHWDRQRAFAPRPGPYCRKSRSGSRCPYSFPAIRLPFPLGFALNK